MNTKMIFYKTRHNALVADEYNNNFDLKITIKIKGKAIL